MLDIRITGGTIVDGTGGPSYVGDVGIKDGTIVAVGHVTEEASETIDAAGALVTPGWVDVHTHYDGQVTWDDVLEPSAANGVTTLVMGNCGVGFAPVRPDGHDSLIDLMEGVEDIPGSALSVGMPWGSWETFSEYLDLLDQRVYSVDIAAQLAHGPLRFYVMGERGADNEDATAEDLAAMTALTREAMEAGAVGFTTSRTIGHKSRSGRPVPGTYAPEEELVALAEAVGASGHGVIEAIVAGSLGPLDAIGGERATQLDEVPLLEAMGRASNRPVTFSLFQTYDQPEHWRDVLHAALEANTRGVELRPQVIPRSVTIMTSLENYHLFSSRPTYLKIADLPLAERVAEMRRPEVRAQILSEEPTEVGPGDFTTLICSLFGPGLGVTFRLEAPIDYEPTLEESILAEAMALGKDPEAHMYDCLLEHEGRAFFALLGSNYVSGNLDVCREMLLEPATISGLGDAGAHVNLISDCSASTFQLTHWGRDRTKGEKLPLELIVHKLSGANAALYGFDDRGTVEVGKRADLNVIDFDNLEVQTPVARHDLPMDQTRILQGATGYLATMVSGVITRRHDADTGARPGRLVRAGAS